MHWKSKFFALNKMKLVLVDVGKIDFTFQLFLRYPLPLALSGIRLSPN